jgi:hypothetical protein
MLPARISLSGRVGRARMDGYNPLRTLALWSVLSFGFFLQFDIMTATYGLRFQRATDGLMFLYTPFLFLLVGIGPTLRYGVPYFVILFGLVFATLLLKAGVEQGDMYLTLIYLLTGVYCFYFAMLARDETFLVYFAIGTVLGLLPSLLVLFLQGQGNMTLANMGLGVPLDYLPLRAARLSRVKLGGMWTHGNEAGHVYAIATASALYLSLKFKRPIIYITSYCLLIASFTFTLNRSGLIAPTLGLIYCYIRLGNLSLYIKTAAVVASAALILAIMTSTSGLDSFYDAIQKRFVSDEYANTNIAERLGSNLAGADIALEHPFGIGAEERITLMLHQTTNGIESVHNGFLSLAYQSGVGLSMLYILSGIYLLARRRSVQSAYIIMFLFTATSMFFEELSINQCFIFSVALTIAAAWLNYSTGLRHGPLTKMRSTLSGRRVNPIEI